VPLIWSIRYWRLPSGGLLAEAIAAAKQEARASGLTDEAVDAELEAWRAERKT